ncbi:DUF3991 domain-containing protein (plasmid) [Rhizobium oryzihabitans]|uniref:DUF3991 domain-containing protein n=1 Tax=Rhizobium oryzihabitans TaxID=2267833 RepID=A0A7L5BRL2_9HYPH|nr:MULTISPECIES: DUF3991 and toprim domain-containing protein [Rhizobium/Agrobacterium group]QIB41454.1 DUF3991 domain-containing protein [Rhizobium oryzihabitans]RSC24786.1 DUF3991 domain-containing protein [Agrobacterium sp. FDAARGOS_525]RSC24868.1 DUF3991 domain-containing protein [Agrobacterium sp. FDAARGOS_525]
MKREEIERIREAVSCAAVLERAGFALDIKESTRRAVKFRRGSEIVIVTRDGRGWFDPLSEDKGDVFTLVALLEHLSFPDAVDSAGELIGYQVAPVVWKKTPTNAEPVDLTTRWKARRIPGTGSGAWRYLCSTRAIPASIMRAAISQGSLREGPYGSMWAAHRDNSGAVVGWEERGPDWRGFSTGGNKILFRLGEADALRLCVTEAAIDAMSLAAIEDLQGGSLYLSTGGGWSPRTEAALVELLGRSDTLIVCATDANHQGDAFAERLQALAAQHDRRSVRLRPPLEDWNEVLKERRREGSENENRKRRAASPSTASRKAAPG